MEDIVLGFALIVMLVILFCVNSEQKAKTQEFVAKNSHDKNGEVMCPYCKSKQITVQKRGWSMTTGMIGSNKLERVCMSCMKKF